MGNIWTTAASAEEEASHQVPVSEKREWNVTDLSAVLSERRQYRVCGDGCAQGSHSCAKRYGEVPSMAEVERMEVDETVEVRLDEEHFDWFSPLGFAVFEHNVSAAQTLLLLRGADPNGWAYEFSEWDASMGSFSAVELAAAMALTDQCTCSGPCHLVQLVNRTNN